MKEKLTMYQKLHKLQSTVVGLGKDKASNNYKYVTGDKVLSYVKPLMNEYGLLLKQEVLSIENERMDYKTGIGTQYEKPKSEILSKVMMRFTWIDIESGEKDENLFGANGQNDWEKGLGSALTYAERYFLLKYFHIATDEDDIDNPDRKESEPQQTASPQNKGVQTQNKPQPIQIDVTSLETRLRACKSLDELGKTYLSFTANEKVATESLKNELKTLLK